MSATSALSLIAQLQFAGRGTTLQGRALAGRDARYDAVGVHWRQVCDQRAARRRIDGRGAVVGAMPPQFANQLVSLRTYSMHEPEICAHYIIVHDTRSAAFAPLAVV